MSSFHTALLTQIAVSLLPVLARRYGYRRTLSPEIVQRTLDQCRSAWDYDLRSPAAIGDFVDLGLQLGMDFHAHPAVHAVLTDPDIPANARMRELLLRLRPLDWIAVRAWLARTRMA